MNVIYNIIVCIVCLIGLEKLGSMFFRKKGTITGQYICFLALYTILKMLLPDNYMIFSIVKQTLLLLFFFLIFYGNRWEKLGLSCVLVSVWEFTSNAAASALFICDILLSENKWMPYERINEHLIEILSFLISMVCMYLLFCKTKLAEGNFLHGDGKLLFSASGLLLILMDVCLFGITRGIVMVSNGSGVNYWNTTYNEVLTHLEVLVLSALCLIICLSLLFGMNRLIGYLTIDNLHKMEISRYQGILEQYQEQTNVKHDLKNHLISLSALAEHEEWDKLKDYLLKMYHAGMIGEDEIETGNSVVNAIVNTKRQTAKQKNITFDCNVNIAKPLLIDEYDLCIIWGNILDNAIKAADASMERYIFVQAEIVKRNLIINVKNATASDIVQNDFGTKDWGTGLKNVNKIVQKENGIMEIKRKDAVFDISIMLPIVDCPSYRT